MSARKDKTKMSRSRSIAALLVLGAGVAACGGPAAREANTTLYSVNQPVVQRTEYVLDLATGPEGVPPAEIGRLHGWFQGLQVAYGDRISIDEGAGGYRDGTVREAIAAAAGRYGLLMSENAPVTAGTVQPGTIRVVLSRTTASVPDCPNWSNRIGGYTSTSPNYGCAINSNIAAMIADPNDLVLGQTGSGSDAATTTRAIRSYRDAAPTGTRGLQDARPTGGR
jgi:pilus assembly protein CpaD